MADVPGWLSFRDEESARILEGVEVSQSTWDAYEGMHSVPTPSVSYSLRKVLYVDPPPAGTMLAAIDRARSIPTSSG